MIKAIVFDKDGTLIELGQTWDEPTVKMMEEMFKLTTLTKDEQVSFAREMGINEAGTGIVPNSIFAAGSIYDQAVELSRVVDLPVAEIEEKIEQSYLHFLQTQDLQAKLSPGVEEMLQTLKQSYKICLVTNDNFNLTEVTLGKLNVLHYFDFIGCADQYGPKPNPSALIEISKQFNIGLDEMVYVGDSALDMIYGGHTRAAIGYIEDPAIQDHLHAADYLIEDFNELPALIETIAREGVK